MQLGSSVGRDVAQAVCVCLSLFNYSFPRTKGVSTVFTYTKQHIYCVFLSWKTLAPVLSFVSLYSLSFFHCVFFIVETFNFKCSPKKKKKNDEIPKGKWGFCALWQHYSLQFINGFFFLQNKKKKTKPSSEIRFGFFSYCFLLFFFFTLFIYSNSLSNGLQTDCKKKNNAFTARRRFPTFIKGAERGGKRFV